MVRERFTPPPEQHASVPSADELITQAQTIFETRQTVSIKDADALQAQAREQVAFETTLGSNLFMALQELGLAYLLPSGPMDHRVPGQALERAQIRARLGVIEKDASTGPAMQSRKAWVAFANRVCDAYELLHPTLKKIVGQQGMKASDASVIAAK